MITKITNGRIITPTQSLMGWDLWIKDDRILGISPRGEFPPQLGTQKVDEVLDAKGGYLMPGFIDLHADYIEHMAGPRPTSLMDFTLALRESERELVTHGITTMFHSLSFLRRTEFGVHPLRKTENVWKFAQIISQAQAQEHLIRHRFHARFEVDCLGDLSSLEDALEKGWIHLLSLMDHSPGQGQYRSLEVYKKTLHAYRGSTLSEGELVQILDDHQTKEKLTLEQMLRLSEKARFYGVTLASHDDDTVEKVELTASIGASISEFPITLEAARAAKERGLFTILGAPNILLGGSHSGNLCAAQAIIDGCADILCSDYYPPALLHALFIMERDHGIDLPTMVRMVSLNPASALGWEAETGSLEPGKKADILVVEQMDDGFPMVTTAMVNGVKVHQSLYRRAP